MIIATDGSPDKDEEEDESKAVWKTVETKMIDRENLATLCIVNLASKIMDKFFSLS